MIASAFVWASCGSNSSKGNSVDENDSISTELSEDENISDEDETINGLIPGQLYCTKVSGVNVDITLYKDGTVSSKSSGEGWWKIVSKHDQPFVVIVFNLKGAYANLYIDNKLCMHVDSPSGKGYELDAIGYIPKDAKGMEIGKKYKGEFSSFISSRRISITLLEGGKVEAIDQWEDSLYFEGWTKETIDGTEYIRIGIPSTTHAAVLIDKGLNHYFICDELLENDEWKEKWCEGKLKEEK